MSLEKQYKYRPARRSPGYVIQYTGIVHDRGNPQWCDIPNGPYFEVKGEALDYIKKYLDKPK